MQVFQGADFSGSTFSRMQIFKGTGFSDAYFSGYRLFSVRDQGMGLGLRSGQQVLTLSIQIFFYQLFFKAVVQHQCFPEQTFDRAFYQKVQTAVYQERTSPNFFFPVKLVKFFTTVSLEQLSGNAFVSGVTLRQLYQNKYLIWLTKQINTPYKKLELFCEIGFPKKVEIFCNNISMMESCFNKIIG